MTSLTLLSLGSPISSLRANSELNLTMTASQNGVLSRGHGCSLSWSSSLMFLPPISANTSTIPPPRRVSKNQDSHTQADVDTLVNLVSADKFQLNVYYYTLYSLSVFSLAKSLQLILEINATYRLVSYLLDWPISRMRAQCMISNKNINSGSLRWCVCRYFLQNNV